MYCGLLSGGHPAAAARVIVAAAVRHMSQPLTRGQDKGGEPRNAVVTASAGCVCYMKETDVKEEAAILGHYIHLLRFPLRRRAAFTAEEKLPAGLKFL